MKIQFCLVLATICLLGNSEARNQTKASALPSCNVPRNVSVCITFIRTWHFNPQSGHCEIFKSCNDAGRGFKNAEDCERKCKVVQPRSGKSVCNLPPQPGPCKSYLRSFYYDMKSEKCNPFVYGGCGGNGNRFSSLAACEKTCLGLDVATKETTSQETKKKPAKSKVAITQKTIKTNRTLKVGVTQSTKTNPPAKSKVIMSTQKTKTIAYIKSKNVNCNLPPQPGPCRINVPSFYYDMKTGKCAKFGYGGCSGNSNRFSSQAACEKMCLSSNVATKEETYQENIKKIPARSKVETTTKKIPTSKVTTTRNAKTIAYMKSKNPSCNLPKQPGECKAYQPSFYYDMKTGKCDKFGYGGCGGNGNRFLTQDDCEKACLYVATESATYKSKNPNCNLPRQPGTCRAHSSAFYYDVKTGKCAEFSYGGCRGNANRFATQEECEKACFHSSETVTTEEEARVSKNPKCNLPPATGPGRAKFRAFYYDMASGQCKRFIYSGCGGNANHFPAQRACEMTCFI